MDRVDRGRRSSSPGALLLAIEPLTFPARCDLLRARLGDPVDPGAARRPPGRPDRQRAQRGAGATRDAGAERVALGLLGDLVGHARARPARADRAGAPAGRARRLAGRRAGCFPGPLARAAGRLLVRARRRVGGPAGRRSRRSPAAGPARGRARLREGREPRLLGGALAGARPAARREPPGAGRRALRPRGATPRGRALARCGAGSRSTPTRRCAVRSAPRAARRTACA